MAKQYIDIPQYTTYNEIASKDYIRFWFMFVFPYKGELVRHSSAVFYLNDYIAQKCSFEFGSIS